MIFGQEQRENNNNITRNSSRSDILALLTLLSVDSSSTVLLRVLSLTRVQVRNFPLLHLPKWLSLVHGQLAMSLQHVKKLVICKCFCLFDIKQWSVLSEVLPSPSQKFILEKIQLGVNIHQNNRITTGLNIFSILEDLLKMAFVNVTETSSRLHFRERF